MNTKKTVAHAVSASRRGRVVGVISGVAAATTLALAIAGALVTVQVALTVVKPVRRRVRPERILDDDPQEHTVTLKETDESVMPGRLGLWFDHDRGYAQLGDIVRHENGRVTRRVHELRGTSPLRGRAWITGNYYVHPEELGIPYQDVHVPTDLGPTPAWLFPATDQKTDTWMIGVHGWRSSRQELLRAVPLFHEAGYNALLMTYRNDVDAPASSDRRYGLGGTEWRDIDAAITFAQQAGARSIVLMGWSMGGAIVLQTVTRTSHPELIAGIVLESPVIDWVDTLRFQAGLLHLPDVVFRGALGLLTSSRARPVTGLAEGINFGALDFVARSGDLTVPTLLMHSDDDVFVPSGPSRALATSRDDIVTFVPFTQAMHTQLWNNDEHKWSRAITSWLTRLT